MVSPLICAPLGLLAIGYPETALANLIFAVFWLIKRRREGWLSAVCLVIGLGFAPSYLGLHPFSSPPDHSIRVMTCNANYFDSLDLPDRVSRANRIEEIAAFLREQKPDLLCCQDFTADGLLEAPVLATLKDQCGLSYRYHQGFSQEIFSRYPIQDPGFLNFPESSNSFLWADIKTPLGVLRILNLHLQSYALGALPRRTPRAVYDTLVWGLRKRVEQADLVAQNIASSPYPVLVCGDFNDVPLSHAYRTVVRGLSDGFRSAGWGSGITYRGPLPCLRIDYILCSPQLQISRYRIPPSDFSDHRPALCELSLSRASPTSP